MSRECPDCRGYRQTPPCKACNGIGLVLPPPPSPEELMALMAWLDQHPDVRDRLASIILPPHERRQIETLLARA